MVRSAKGSTSDNNPLTIDFQNGSIPFDVSDENKIIGGFNLHVIIVACIIVKIWIQQIRVFSRIGVLHEVAKTEDPTWRI